MTFSKYWGTKAPPSPPSNYLGDNPPYFALSLRPSSRHDVDTVSRAHQSSLGTKYGFSSCEIRITITMTTRRWCWAKQKQNLYCRISQFMIVSFVGDLSLSKAADWYSQPADLNHRFMLTLSLPWHSTPCWEDQTLSPDYTGVKVIRPRRQQ